MKGYGRKELVMGLNLDLEGCLPNDLEDAILIGRAWVPGDIPGPSPIVIRGGRILDLSAEMPTVSELLNMEFPLEFVESTNGEDIGSLSDVLTNSDCSKQKQDLPYFLSTNRSSGDKGVWRNVCPKHVRTGYRGKGRRRS